MSNIELNIEGIKNVKIIVDDVVSYIKQAEKELKKVNLTANDEIIGEIRKTIYKLDEINTCISKYNNWIDETVEKLTSAETASIKVMEDASHSAYGLKTTKGASKFATVGRSTVTNPESGKKPSTTNNTNEKGNTTSLSQAEIDYREGRAPGYNPDATNNKTNKNTSNNNTTSKTPERALTDSQIDELYREGYATRAELDRAGDGELLSLWKEYQRDIRMRQADMQNTQIVNQIIGKTDLSGISLDKNQEKHLKDILRGMVKAEDINKSSIKLEEHNGNLFISGKAYQDSKSLSSTFLYYVSDGQNNTLLTYMPGIGEYSSLGKLKEVDNFGRALWSGKISPDVDILMYQTRSATTWRKTIDNNRTDADPETLTNFKDTINLFSELSGNDKVILSGFSGGGHTTKYLANLILSGNEYVKDLADKVIGVIVIDGAEPDDIYVEGSIGYLGNTPCLNAVERVENPVGIRRCIEGISDQLTDDGQMFTDETWEQFNRNIFRATSEGEYSRNNATVVWYNADHMGLNDKVWKSDATWKWIEDLINKTKEANRKIQDELNSEGIDNQAETSDPLGDQRKRYDEKVERLLREKEELDKEYRKSDIK